MQNVSVSLEKRHAASLHPEHLMCKVSHDHLGGNMNEFSWTKINQLQPSFLFSQDL